MMPSLSSAETILLILGAFYLFDSVFWLRSGAVVFSSWGQRCRLALTGGIFPTDEGGFYLAPLAPWSPAACCRPLPVSLFPDGVCSLPVQSLGPRRPHHAARLVRFADLRSVEARDHQLWINGQPFATAATIGEAAHLARLIEALARRPEPKRTRAVLSAVDDHLSVERAAARAAEFHSTAGPLGLACTLLFLWTFVAGPTLLWRLGLHPYAYEILLGYLITYLIVWVAVGVLYLRAHRRLYPDAKRKRRKHAATMAIAPATAMHAYHALSRELFQGLHPLVVARALCDSLSFRRFAGRVLRDLKYPLPHDASDNAEALEAENWFRATLRESIERLLVNEQLDPRELTAPPERDGWDVRSFCPRCEMQFAVATGQCDTCGGRQLQPFERTESPAEA